MDNQSEESINGEKGEFIRMERASGREIKETARGMAPITRAIMMMQSVLWKLVDRGGKRDLERIEGV